MVWCKQEVAHEGWGPVLPTWKPRSRTACPRRSVLPRSAAAHLLRIVLHLRATRAKEGNVRIGAANGRGASELFLHPHRLSVTGAAWPHPSLEDPWGATRTARAQGAVGFSSVASVALGQCMRRKES